MEPLQDTRSRMPPTIGLTLLVLIIGLGVTLGFGQHFHAAHQREVQGYFDYRSQNAQERIEDRLHHYEQAMMSAEALFRASQSVSRTEFATFFAGLNLDERNPGIQGIGFNIWVPAAEKARYLAKIRSQGFPDYQISPEGDRDAYSPVTFIEPFNDRNLRALGFDTYADPVRRAAMELARDTGHLTLSGKVQLIQETGMDLQPGFLAYFPMYKNGQSRQTLEARRRNIIGWISAPFRFNDLMHGIFEESEKDLDFEIYDGPELRSESLMFDKDPAHSQKESANISRRSLTFGNHTWTMVTHPLQGMAARYGTNPSNLVLALGGLTTLLLGLLTFSLSSQFYRERRLSESLEQRVQARTQDLRESEEKFRTVADYTHDWERWDSPEGSVLYCSPSCERITGYTAEEFKRDPGLLERLIHPEDLSKWKTHYASIHDWRRLPKETSGIGNEMDMRITRRDGEVRWINHVCTPILDAEGAFRGHRISNRDFTDRVRLEVQLHQAQKMGSLGILAGGVAHDMNNVLAAILGMAELGSESQSEAVSRSYFEIIAQAAQRGGKMVKSLLSFARQSPVEERELDVNAILRGEVQLLERTTLAKIDLELDLESDLRPIRGDGDALSHAFLNLCVNAVDAMPESGTITLRTRNVDNDWIEVLVEDTGSGMSRDVLEKAMDPFFTTKGVGKGTGLGLSMVYSTIKAHRGQIEIQSEPGLGTRVRMRFPAIQVLFQVPEPMAECRSEPSTRGLSVLLVDDDPLIQSSMQAILAALGHRVTAVLSGEDALAELEAGLKPDVVVLDMNMPGLSGADTLPRLRALNPSVPVLLATGRVDQFASDIAAAHSFVTLLSKPFGMKELQQRLEFLGRG